MAKKITLDEFVFAQLNTLERFEETWMALHRKNRQIYPLKMLAGDWAEQIGFFQEREEQEDAGANPLPI